MKNQAEPRIKARCKRCGRRCTIIVPVAGERGLQFLCGKCLLGPNRLSVPGMKRVR